MPSLFGNFSAATVHFRRTSIVFPQQFLPAWPEAEALAYWYHSHLSWANLRVLFYLVSPEETSNYRRLEDVPDYTMQVAAWWSLLMLLELLVLWITGRHSDHAALDDSMASLSAGILSQLFKSNGRTVCLLVYTWIWQNWRLLELDSRRPAVWVVCLLSQDFAYYLGHRAMHEISLLWALHSVHHSSHHLNLSTALRQPLLQDLGLAPYELLQAFAVPPPLFLVHRYFSHIFQFWLHTSFFGSLGPLGWLLNTPAFHRVHHGRNPYCLDKNFGALLIIWDRLFGTFQAERADEPPQFGLANASAAEATFDPCRMQLLPLKRAFVDKPFGRRRDGRSRFPSLRAKLRALLWPPGWRPALKTRLFFYWRSLKNPGKSAVKLQRRKLLPNILSAHLVGGNRLRTPPPASLKAYLLAHFFLLICMFVHFQYARAQQGWPEFVGKFIFLLSSLLIFGAFLERNKNAHLAEIYRCLAFCFYQLGNEQSGVNFSAPASAWLLSAFFASSALYWTGKRVLLAHGSEQVKEMADVG